MVRHLQNMSIAENKPSKHLWVLVAQTTAFGIFLPLVGSVLFYIFFPQWRWPNEIFHSLIESMGGFIALSMAGLLQLLFNVSPKWTKRVKKLRGTFC